MAASGLNVTQQSNVSWPLTLNRVPTNKVAFGSVQDGDDVQKYWRHLSLLVEFALSMQRTLQSINDQSFNHFVLRIGNYRVTLRINFR